MYGRETDVDSAENAALVVIHYAVSDIVSEKGAAARRLRADIDLFRPLCYIALRRLHSTDYGEQRTVRDTTFAS